MADGSRHLRIVTIGGGTGSFYVLRGLVQHDVYISAVSSSFDNGGSSGEYRDQYGALPQGDRRRCLLALASRPQHYSSKDLSFFRRLLDHRHPEDNKSTGNEILLAASRVEGGPIAGMDALCSFLKINGRVLPVSLTDAHLFAKLCDGTTIEGESSIDRRSINDDRVIRDEWLVPKAQACLPVIEANEQADIIVFCPGDLWTSLIPNLLVDGVADSIARSKAKVVYVVNLMTKWAETRNYDVPRFLKELKRYGFGRDKFDAVLVNNASIPEHLLEYYKAKDKSEPITLTGDKWAEVRQYAKEIIAQDFLDRSEESLREKLIRHDSAKLANCIISL